VIRRFCNSVVSNIINVECQDAFAGKPAPTKSEAEAEATYTAALLTTHQAER
jgi:hypothetical protein